MAADEVPGLRVGQRVLNTENGPQYGTVKFVGGVDGFEGVWVGVDWDNGHGCHNGLVNGVQYFETSGEKSGSFVLVPTLGTGVSLLDALSSKYKANPADTKQEDVYILSVRRTRVAVELVGKTQVEDRQRQLDILRLAALAYAGVCCAGPPGQIRDVAPNIEELDLTGNLLPNWHEVKRICEELPAVRILDLSNSRISFESDAPLPVLSNLTALALNNCGMSWGKVDLLKNCLPHIQDLSLCGNKLRDLKRGGGRAGSVEGPGNEGYVEGFDTLRLLSLEDNRFDSWHEIMKLSQLRSLEQLYLSGNSLHELFYPGPVDSKRSQDGKSTVPPFATLRGLYMGRNKIREWSSVDALDHFPVLQDLRLSENPLSDLKTGTAGRYMLIARIGNLACLNGSQVKPRERRDSEIRYVRHVLTTMQTSDVEEIRKVHPRFEKLRDLHDLPVDSCTGGSTSNNNSQKLATTLICPHEEQSLYFASIEAAISIVCVAATTGERAPITRKLPSSTTIGRLKGLCESICKLQPSQQRLYFKDQDTPLPVPLEDDLETIAEVGLGPGRAIILDGVEGVREPSARMRTKKPLLHSAETDT